MKKLLLIVPQLYGGGAERFVSRLTALLEGQYAVAVVLFDDSKQAYPLSCPCYSLQLPPDANAAWFNRLLHVFRRAHRLKKLKRKLGIDAAISFGDSANLVNVLSRQGERLLTSIRGYGRLARMKTGFYRAMNRFAFQHSDRVICVTAVMLREFQTIFPKQQAKGVLLYNAYDLAEITLQSARQPAHERLFEGHRVILSVGTFRKEKGYLHLLKAFSLLTEQYPDCILLLMGEDSGGNRQRLSSLATQLHINERVYFLEFDANPFSYMARAVVYVQPSLSEGFPNALAEAMACGAPVVAADCKTGPRELLCDSGFERVATDVEQADYGILVPPMEESGAEELSPQPCDSLLAEGIRLLLDNRTLADHYSEKARMRIANFSCERCSADLERILGDCKVSDD